MTTEQGSEQEQGSGTTDYRELYDNLKKEHDAAIEVKDRFEQQRDEARTELNTLRVASAYKDYALSQYDADAPKKIKFLQGLELNDKGEVTGEVEAAPGMTFKPEAPTTSTAPSKSADTNTKHDKPTDDLSAANAYRKANNLPEITL